MGHNRPGRRDYVSSRTPKCFANPTRPTSVIVTARVSLCRVIQPSAKERDASEAPRRPPMCGRRSLQSRQGRQNTRRPGVRFGAELLQQAAAGLTDLSAVGGQQQMSLRAQRVGQRHAEPAGEMVVARAGGAQSLAAAPGASDGCARSGNRHDAFHHLPDQWGGQAIIVVAALPVQRQQTALRSACPDGRWWSGGDTRAA